MAIWKIENGLDLLITALCLDYHRREKGIEEKSASKRVDTEFRYYNFKIFDAAAEIVGFDLAETYIKEIGTRTGYANSKLDFESEVTYKRMKQMVKRNIAIKLHLCD